MSAWVFGIVVGLTSFAGALQAQEAGGAQGLPNLAWKVEDPAGRSHMTCEIFAERVRFTLILGSERQVWGHKVDYDRAIPSEAVLFEKAAGVDPTRVTEFRYKQWMKRTYTFRRSKDSTEMGLIRLVDNEKILTSFGSTPLMAFIDRNCFQGFDLWNKSTNLLRVGAYNKIQNTLRDLHRQFPNHTKLFRLKTADTSRGFSAQKIVGIQVGHSGPADLIVATHHGNEHGSTEVGMGLVQSIVRNPIPGRRTYIIPVLNIAGYEAIYRLEYGLDPNRTYPGPCGSAAEPFGLESTKALGRFLEEKNIVTAITLHNSGNSVTFPWANVKNTFSTVHDEFVRLAKVAVAHNNFKYGTSADVVYETWGNFEDYAFWKHGIWSFLFEMGTSDWMNEIPQMVRSNVAAVRALLEAAPQERAKEHAWNGSCGAMP